MNNVEHNMIVLGGKKEKKNLFWFIDNGITANIAKKIKVERILLQKDSTLRKKLCWLWINVW